MDEFVVGYVGVLANSEMKCLDLGKPIGPVNPRGYVHDILSIEDCDTNLGDNV